MKGSSMLTTNHSPSEIHEGGVHINQHLQKLTGIEGYLNTTQI